MISFSYNHQVPPPTTSYYNYHNQLPLLNFSLKTTTNHHKPLPPPPQLPKLLDLYSEPADMKDEGGSSGDGDRGEVVIDEEEAVGVDEEYSVPYQKLKGRMGGWVEGGS